MRQEGLEKKRRQAQYSQFEFGRPEIVLGVGGNTYHGFLEFPSPQRT